MAVAGKKVPCSSEQMGEEVQRSSRVVLGVGKVVVVRGTMRLVVIVASAQGGARSWEREWVRQEGAEALGLRPL